jgi:hypothetical protein
MGLRPTKSNENASGRARRINDLDRVFNGAPMGLRPIQMDENRFQQQYCGGWLRNGRGRSHSG